MVEFGSIFSAATFSNLDATITDEKSVFWNISWFSAAGSVMISVPAGNDAKVPTGDTRGCRVTWLDAVISVADVTSWVGGTGDVSFEDGADMQPEKIIIITTRVNRRGIWGNFIE
jgi:hypothetical protein